jgi:hypothetical protein
MVLEHERALWMKHYAKRLRKQHQESFEELWNKAFQLADAASVNTRPVALDNIVMSMLVAQQTEIQQLRQELHEIKRKLNGT